jgi:hypothetical protein
VARRALPSVDRKESGLLCCGPLTRLLRAQAMQQGGMEGTHGIQGGMQGLPQLCMQGMHQGTQGGLQGMRIIGGMKWAGWRAAPAAPGPSPGAVWAAAVLAASAI